jgi:hypothetical protein
VNNFDGRASLQAEHERARKLIDQHHVERLAEGERSWLDAHLAGCESCTEIAQSTESALRAMRSAVIPFPAGLASRTQFRVHLRAQQLQEREPRSLAVWAVAGLSWLLGIATAPYVWQLFAWTGERLRIPKLVWELGFGLWWLVPALVAGGILWFSNSGEKLGGELTQR